MNAVTESFLNVMKGKIEADVEIDMKSQVNERLCKNLSTLVKEKIITKEDAEEFAKKNGFSLNPPKKSTLRAETKVEKRKVADDGCGHSTISRMSSC